MKTLTVKQNSSRKNTETSGETDKSDSLFEYVDITRY